jgi:hypothetical protein
MPSGMWISLTLYSVLFFLALCSLTVFFVILSMLVVSSVIRAYRTIFRFRYANPERRSVVARIAQSAMCLPSVFDVSEDFWGCCLHGLLSSYLTHI